MTSRERLLAVLQRRAPDAVPIWVRGVSPFGDRMNWMGRHDASYERLRRFVLEHGDILHGIGLDAGIFLSSVARGVETVIAGDGRWRDIETRIETPKGPIRKVTRFSTTDYFEDIVEHYVKADADYERFMSIPYEPVRPDVAPRVAEAQRTVGDRGIVAVGIPSAINYVHELLGSETMALWSVLERARLRELFETMQERVVDYVTHLVESGAGPVLSYTGPELALPPLLAPADFREFVAKIDRPVHEVAHAHGCYTWVHSHGKTSTVLEEFAGMGADVLEPVEVPPGGNVTLTEAKRRIGDRVVLMGNMPYEALLSWAPGRIEAKVKADCEAAMEGGGYIMMPAASPFERVLTDAAFENYKTYVLAGRKHGRY